MKLIRTLVLMLPLAISACREGATTSRTADSGPRTKDTGLVETPDLGMETPDAGDVDTGILANCDLNPQGCAPNQIKGPAPACDCRPQCLPGYSWTGSACLAETDAGFADTGLIETDTGVTPTDTGVTPTDTGVTPTDTGVTPTDTGVTPTDTGVDGGVVVVPDAGPDGGFIFADAAVDGGVNPDAGPANCQTGVTELDLCDPDNFNCCGGPDVVCEPILSPTDPNDLQDGICLRSCNTGANTGANGLSNPLCTGGATDCVDYFEHGATNARCLNVIPSFGDRDRTEDVQVCDPRVTNMFIIPGDSAAGTGRCMPLCTVQPSTTNPTNYTCAAPHEVCTGVQFIQDGDSNVYGPCAHVVARNQPCDELNGTTCAADDVCLAGFCRQRLGTTCTAAPACATAGQACIELGAAPDTVAFCHQPCTLLQSGDCGATGACTVIADARNPATALGTCRFRNGIVADGGDCSDIIGVGSNTSVCDDGLMCLETVTANDFTQASCFQLCDTTTNAPCTGGLTCFGIFTDLPDFGVCSP